MRKLAVLLALAVAPAALAMTAPRGTISPGPVTGLAVDGYRVAFASGPVAGDCGHVRIWNVHEPKPRRLGRGDPCPEITSTGSGLIGPELGGTRALWITYVGGNLREWSLWTATERSPKPRRLRFVPRDVDAPPPIVLGEGDAGGKLDDLLPYAVDDLVVALRSGGGRAFTWTAPAPVRALAAREGELAVAVEGGAVYVLGAGGGVVQRLPAGEAVDALRLTDDGVLVQRGRRLALQGADLETEWMLAPGTQLLDSEGALALLRAGGRLRLLPLDGRLAVDLGPAAHAQLESTGLVHSAGRRVTFVRMKDLLRKLD
jgi:hypothetical protein